MCFRGDVWRFLRRWDWTVLRVSGWVLWLFVVDGKRSDLLGGSIRHVPTLKLASRPSAETQTHFSLKKTHKNTVGDYFIHLKIEKKRCFFLFLFFFTQEPVLKWFKPVLTGSHWFAPVSRLVLSFSQHLVLLIRASERTFNLDSFVVLWWIDSSFYKTVKHFNLIYCIISSPPQRAALPHWVPHALQSTHNATGTDTFLIKAALKAWMFSFTPLNSDTFSLFVDKLEKLPKT